MPDLLKTTRELMADAEKQAGGRVAMSRGAKDLVRMDMLAQLLPPPVYSLPFAEGGEITVDDTAEYEAYVRSMGDDPSTMTIDQWRAQRQLSAPPVVRQEQGAEGRSEASPGAVQTRLPDPPFLPMDEGRRGPGPLQPDEGDYSFMQAPYERERAAQIARAYDDPSNAIAPLPSSYEDMRRLQAMGMVDEQGRQTDTPSPGSRAVQWATRPIGGPAGEAYEAIAPYVQKVLDPALGAMPQTQGFESISRLLGGPDISKNVTKTLVPDQITPLDVALTAIPAGMGARSGLKAGESVGRAAVRGLLEGFALDPTQPGQALRGLGSLMPEGAVGRTIAPPALVRPGRGVSPTEGEALAPLAGGAPKRGEVPRSTLKPDELYDRLIDAKQQAVSHPRRANAFEADFNRLSAEADRNPTFANYLQTKGVEKPTWAGELPSYAVYQNIGDARREFLREPGRSLDELQTFADELTAKAGGNTRYTVELTPAPAASPAKEAGAEATGTSAAEAGSLDDLGITGTAKQQLNRVNQLADEGRITRAQAADYKESILEGAKEAAVPSRMAYSQARNAALYDDAAKPFIERAQASAADGQTRYVYATPSGREPFGITTKTPTTEALSRFWKVTPDGTASQVAVPKFGSSKERLAWLKAQNASALPGTAPAGAGRRTWAEIEAEQAANRFTPGNINPSGPPPGATQRVTSPTRPPAAPPPTRGGTSLAEPPAGGGPPLPPTGAGAADEPFAANIRLSKYPDEVRETIRTWADDHADLVQDARRGVRSDAQVLEDARSLVDDVGGDFDKIQKGWKPGQAWNAEEVTAIRGALTDSTRKVMETALLSRSVDSMANQALLADAILEQQKLQQIVHGVTAEAGRSLRAFRQSTTEALAGGDVARMQELLRLSIGKSEPAELARLADAIKALDPANPTSVNKFIRNINKPGFWDKLHFYWMNSILSGPITQARNIVGNTGATLYSPVQRLGAAAIEQPLAAIQGRQAQRFWQEAPASVAGMFHGIPEGVRGAITTARTGISPRAAAKMDVRPSPIGGVFGRIVGAPVTGLGMMDEFFSAINYRSGLWANAQRMARTEGLRGEALTNRIANLISDPPPGLMKQATEGAENLVFRGDVGDMARSAAFLRSKVPGGRYILPFLNTPANLLKYGIKNSPLGLLDATAWKKALAGNPEGADELANAFVGSAIAASLSTMVATGVMDITAAVPVNAAERDRFFREGKMPFSVRIPGIGWVEYKQLPMLDTTFTLVASAVDGIRRGEDVSGIASQAGANIATNLLDKSYMSGIGDLLDVVQDPTRYAERYVTRQLSGYMPFSGLSRQSAGFIDTTVRDPEGFKETIQSQIPFASKGVPPRLTAFGEEAKRGLPSPMKVSEPKQSDVDKVLGELGIEVGFVGNLAAADVLSDDEEREYQRLYQEVAGKLVYMDLVDLIAAEAWKTADQSEKQELIEKTTASSRAEVRKALASLIEKQVATR